MRSMKTPGLLAALLLSVFAQAGRAADITYDVNESVGPGFVNGTITTDGTIGTLGYSDIVSWNLNINDGTDGTYNLNTINSGELVGGSDVTATATQLLFDFDGQDGGYFVFEHPCISCGGPIIAYDSQFANFYFPQSIDISTSLNESFFIEPTFTGDLVIASAAATPEPSSASLFALGLLGVLFAVNRSRRWRASMTA